MVWPISSSTIILEQNTDTRMFNPRSYTARESTIQTTDQKLQTFVNNFEAQIFIVIFGFSIKMYSNENKQA